MSNERADSPDVHKGRRRPEGAQAGEGRPASTDGVAARQQEAAIGAQDRMLQFFSFAHLPEALQKVSEPFCTLAYEIVASLPANPERTVCLRKLLEAKDCAVRALLYKG